MKRGICLVFSILLLCVGCGTATTVKEPHPQVTQVPAPVQTESPEAVPPHTHDLTAADCVTPPTCRLCGATVGEPLGHDFMDPACERPRTCRVCGKTEGPALGHSLTEADYYHSAVCTVCGATVGEKKPAGFVAAAIPVEDLSKAEASFLFHSGGWKDGTAISYEAEINLWLPEFSTTESDAQLTAFSPMGAVQDGYQVTLPEAALDKLLEVTGSHTGYQWQGMLLHVAYTMRDRTPLGYRVLLTDYYDTDLWESSATVLYDLDGVQLCSHQVPSPEGTVLVYALSGTTEVTKNSDGLREFDIYTCFYCPQGYDGCVAGLLSGLRSWDGRLTDAVIYPYETNLYRFR